MLIYSKSLIFFAHFIYFFQALSAVGPSLWSAVSTCQTPAASPSAVTSIKVVRENEHHFVFLKKKMFTRDDSLIIHYIYMHITQYVPKTF